MASIAFHLFKIHCLLNDAKVAYHGAFALIDAH